MATIPVTYKGLRDDFQIHTLEQWKRNEWYGREPTPAEIQRAWKAFIEEVCSEYPQTRNLKRNKKRWIEQGFKYRK